MSGLFLEAFYLWGLSICSTNLFCYLCVLFHCMNIPHLSNPLLITLIDFLFEILSLLLAVFSPLSLSPWEHLAIGPWGLFHSTPITPFSPDPNSKDPRTEYAPGTNCCTDSWVAAAADSVWGPHGTERWPELPAPGDTSGLHLSPPSSLVLAQWNFPWGAVGRPWGQTDLGSSVTAELISTCVSQTKSFHSRLSLFS